MANKVAPKISKPGSDRFPQKGPHNPNVGTSGKGIAPKPKGGAALPGNDRPSAPEQAALARVKNVGMGQTQGRMPVQNPPANVVGQKIGQPEPQTSAAATQKPARRKTPAPFYGEF